MRLATRAYSYSAATPGPGAAWLGTGGEAGPDFSDRRQASAWSRSMSLSLAWSRLRVGWQESTSANRWTGTTVWQRHSTVSTRARCLPDWSEERNVGPAWLKDPSITYDTIICPSVKCSTHSNNYQRGLRKPTILANCLMHRQANKHWPSIRVI